MTKTQKKTAKINININLAQSETIQNYWSLLTCLVEARKEIMEEISKPIATTRSKVRGRKGYY